MTGEPPSAGGAVHDSDTDALPSTSSTLGTASGTAAGDSNTCDSGGSDTPTALTASTRNSYCVPLTSPGTTRSVSGDAGCSTRVHSSWPASRYSTR